MVGRESPPLIYPMADLPIRCFSLPSVTVKTYAPRRAGAGFWIGDLALFSNQGLLLLIGMAPRCARNKFCSSQFN
jgi:hypothetical protein